MCLLPQELGEAKAAEERAQLTAPVPLPARVVLLAMALLYCAFAYHINQVGVGGSWASTAACAELRLAASRSCCSGGGGPRQAASGRRSRVLWLAQGPAAAHPLPCPALLEVRTWLGIALRPDAAGLDAFNVGAAALLLCYALWVSVTGRKV